MDYKQAVLMALDGDEEGYRLLYEATYKSKYYLALKYMKDEDAAQDVLQDAYAKAFSRLDTLKTPEAFPGWLGMIVANLAKNALQKKNPLLFSEAESDTPDEDPFYLDVEDEKEENQPELSYSKQETQTLVREMIDSLSEEQRVCILMYEIEGIPIKDIAVALQCSENTVKSRLSYGRKNLKRKAEELQKKGYKLYTLAPLPLLLYLLRGEQSNLLAEGVLAAAEQQAAQTILSAAGQGTAQAASHTAAQAAVHGAKAAAGAAKQGFIHTVAGKITVAVVSTAVTCGVVSSGFMAANYLNNRKPENPAPESSISQPVESAQPPESQQPESQPPQSQEPQIQTLKDEDYENLIAGNLTREEVEYVLAYGPEEISEQGMSTKDLFFTINKLCMGGKEDPDAITPIPEHGYDAQYRSIFAVEDINRLLRSFTDVQLSEKNTGANAQDDYLGYLLVEGDMVTFSVASLSASYDTQIVSAEYTPEQMTLYFTWHADYAGGGGKETINKRAILYPDEDGKYRIHVIEEATLPEDTTSGENQSAGETGKTPEQAYDEVLESIKTQGPGDLFSENDSPTGEIAYFFHDMDGDGISELIVGSKGLVTDVFYGMYCRIYRCEKTGDGYKPVLCAGETLISSEYLLPSDGKGLLTADFSRGTGVYEIDRFTLDKSGNRIEKEWLSEYDFLMGSDEANRFMAENPPIEWKILVE